MTDTATFLARISDVTGATDLQLAPGQPVTVPCGGNVLLQIHAIRPGIVELSAELDCYPDLSDRTVLGTLLAANHLGSGSGGGRIGLVRGSLVLCERLVLADISDSDIEERIEDFVRMAAFWGSEAGADMFRPPVAISYDHLNFRG